MLAEEYTQEWKSYSSSPEESNDPSVDLFLACDKQRAKKMLLLLFHPHSLNIMTFVTNWRRKVFYHAPIILKLMYQIWNMYRNKNYLIKLSKAHTLPRPQNVARFAGTEEGVPLFTGLSLDDSRPGEINVFPWVSTFRTFSGWKDSPPFTRREFPPYFVGSSPPICSPACWWSVELMKRFLTTWSVRTFELRIGTLVSPGDSISESSATNPYKECIQQITT